MSEEENEFSTAMPEPTPAARREKHQAPRHDGFIDRTGQFVRDTRAEMRRVSWPSFNMVKNTTIITIIAVIFFAAYLFVVDRVWAFLIDHLRTLMGGV